MEAPLRPCHQLTPIDDANRIGRVFRGGVLLLTDVSTYSAGDIFAAAYQDHEIGPVIGVDPATGGGGGNVWTHQDILRNLPVTPDLPLQKLPDGYAAIGDLALHPDGDQCWCWVGRTQGVPPDPHFLPPDSAQSLMDGFPGVVRHACRMLGAGKEFLLRVRSAALAPMVPPCRWDSISKTWRHCVFLSIPGWPFRPRPALTRPHDSPCRWIALCWLTGDNPDTILLSIKGFAALPGAQMDWNQ